MSTRRRGRPRSEPDKRLSIGIQVRVTVEEHRDLAQAAELSGKSLSAWARGVLVRRAKATKAPRQPNRTTPNIPTFSRGMPDVREFFEDLSQNEDYPDHVQRMGKAFMLWLQGRLGKNDEADAKLSAAFKGRPSDAQ